MDTPSQQNLNQLPPGTLLGDFKITGIVGEGGFGIVYLAYEAALDRTVAIKEYLPSSIAGRTGNQSVMVRSQLNSNAFASGLKNFLREAQLLARFSHPAMVEVHRVWEQNSTAYMAMRFYPGKTLRELRQSANEFDEMSIRRVLEPVFDALSLLHAQNVIHRDVSPDNILMRGNGSPVLLDLGAARLVIGGMTQALTTVLKPGYAPIEQYVDDGTMHQGPWTDVYGLGAVLYFLLTGSPPPQAVARMITDPLKNLDAVATVKVPDYFTDAVVKALAVRPENRYQSVDELREALGWTEPLAEPRTTYVRIDTPTRAGTPAASPATTLAPPPTSQRGVRTAPATGVAMPLDKVFEQDSDATVVWKGPPVTGQPARPKAATAAPGQPPPPAVAPSAAIQPQREYGQSAASGGKTWLVAALIAALIGAGAGYFFLLRPAAPSTSTVVSAGANTVAGSGTGAAVTGVGTSEPSPSVPSKPVNPTPAAATAKAEPVPAPSGAAAPSAAKAAADAARVAAESSSREPVRPDTDDQVRAKREAEEKAKAKLEAQDKAAKAKQEADDRAKAKARIEAEERAAAAARAEAEERARRARAEEEERLAAARARQEAEKQAKASSATPPPPPQRSVNELSALALAAYKRGELLAARALWNEIASHPEANARSRATAFSNQAMSYCLNGDESNCERYFTSALRADRTWTAEAGERDHPHVKPSYTRALRAVRAGG
jgi:non-specific serine/threonine protein kinase